MQNNPYVSDRARGLHWTDGGHMKRQQICLMPPDGDQNVRWLCNVEQSGLWMWTVFGEKVFWLKNLCFCNGFDTFFNGIEWWCRDGQQGGQPGQVSDLDEPEYTNKFLFFVDLTETTTHVQIHVNLPFTGCREKPAALGGGTGCTEVDSRPELPHMGHQLRTNSLRWPEASQCFLSVFTLHVEILKAYVTGIRSVNVWNLVALHTKLCLCGGFRNKEHLNIFLILMLLSMCLCVHGHACVVLCVLWFFFSTNL